MKMRKKDTAYIKWVAKDRIHSIRAQSSNGTKGSVTPYNRGTGALDARTRILDAEPMYHHLPDIKGFGIEATADQIGLGRQP